MKSGVILVVALGVLATGGFALAQMDGPPQPDGPMQGLMRGHGRLADRFLANFDLNHDGKVVRDEMNKAEGARFAAAHGANGIGQDQYAAMHMRAFQQHVQQMFRRLDWNGDGRLSLDEYAGPQRVRFEMMDRDGTGSESCRAKPLQQASFKPRGGGRERFCADNDLNRDGNVTHAEFDGATAKHFAVLTANSKAMTPAQFAADALTHYRDLNLRFFKRMDSDHDGKLSLAEYSASDIKLFARMDKNRDGVVTREELSSRAFHGGARKSDGYKRPASRG